ncbi:MAG: LptF/LptG family permease [Muribaculaceae bacterium]|nr:LptF/LptG family permease [Muribaculaceae bacterium]
MLKIKRLYTFMLQSFLPLFLMTFFICLFIVLMQFLWRYIDDLVGKGLEVSVIAELFFYAALTMVPMALPLAVLLASLMTFGNLGERFELTAMKASGVSLLKAMRPLMVLMTFVAIGAFFFQNNVLPIAQTKMWTLLYSMRQKSPELEIPEGVFYDQIPGYNLFVQSKDRNTGMLNNVMIYDMSAGFDNARIILADSGKMSMTSDKTHLFLRLYDGEQFENLKEQGGTVKGNVPYRREMFDSKEILISFDANFNRMDEDGMRNQYVGKNIEELQATIDSVNHRIDSIGTTYGEAIKQIPYLGIPYYERQYAGGGVIEVPQKPITLEKPLDIDSLYRGKNAASQKGLIAQAITKAKRNRQDYEFRSYQMRDDRKTIRRHGIELHKKFTLSFACIIFFFIGAPLGAIIRKGGLGMPLVISVFLFIFYYIIDNSGYKMAREGRLEVWEGMWLSSAVLLPLGIFFTYKSVNDSAVFNRDAYANFFRRIFGYNEIRNVQLKEVIMDEVVVADALVMLQSLADACSRFTARYARTMSYVKYWMQGIDRDEISGFVDRLEGTVEYMSNSRDKIVINKLMDYPVIRRMWFHQPSYGKWMSYASMIVFPVGLPVYLIGLHCHKKLLKEVAAVANVTREIQTQLKKQLDK